MDGPESFRCVCRICRSYNLSLNWNEDLDEFIRMSYKDCFYKYTQFRETKDVPLSQFVCEDCASAVKNFHLAVQKSLETLKLCGLQFAIASRSSSGVVGDNERSTATSICDKNGIPKKHRPKSDDNVFSERLISTQKETYFPIEYSSKSSEDYDISQESNMDGVGHGIIAKNEKGVCEDLDGHGSSRESCFENIKMNVSSEQDVELNQESTNVDTTSRVLGLYSSVDEATLSPLSDDITAQEVDDSDNIHAIECVDFVEFDTDLCGATDDQQSTPVLKSLIGTRSSARMKNKASQSKDTECGTSKASPILLDFDDKPRKKISKTPVMCSYCSKIVHNIYYLKLHEQTHEENRTREVTCPTCGIKLFNKQTLYIHKKTHDKNRVKKYKCEFCDKAFFNRGACNVHRRIHLGQMTQCPLCPKQFYRQVELDRHLPTHSHESLNSSNRAKPKKYYVHCKECGKKVISDRFNAHRAVHKNDPFMRCTICEKDFFCRVSGGRHMSRVHKRKGGHYDDITLYYKNKDSPRRSFLIMKQQEDLEPVA